MDGKLDGSLETSLDVSFAMGCVDGGRTVAWMGRGRWREGELGELMEGWDSTFIVWYGRWVMDWISDGMDGQ